MGTTLDALNAGSLTYKYVIAIEGYQYLITNAATAAAVTAWAGSDWGLALGGLFVEMDNQGTAHPWQPFHGGGTCTLRVTDATGLDTFGIDTHRKLAGAETYLAATADRNDTTITVKDTTSFAASGDAFIGTECFAYTAKTATTFTGCTRGKYAPFTTDSGGRWAGFHRQGLGANRVSLDPIVSAQPRTWIGKWVAVYIHRDIGGVLDVKAQAQLVYAGKIVEIRDDPSGITVVQLKHVMDTIGEAMLGRDQWSANVVEGIYMKAGQFFGMSDYSAFPGTTRTANNLTCVASGAAGTNQFNEGYYTIGQLGSVINSWFEGERVAARIYGVYSIESPVSSNVGLRSKIYYKIPNAGSTHVSWGIRLPVRVAVFLGFVQEDPAFASDTGHTTIQSGSGKVSNTSYLFQSAAPPLRAILTHMEISNQSIDLRMGISDEVGTFVDQFEVLPRANKPSFGDLGLEWGVFSFNDSNYMIGAKVGAELRYVMPALGFTLPGASTTAAPWSGSLNALTVTIEQVAPIVVRQIFALDTSFGELIKNIFYGSGVAGFNHASFDALGYGLGIGIPGSLLGDVFESSVDALAGAGANLLVVIDKPTKLADLITGDLVLRWSFPRWKQGIISFASWSLEFSATAPILNENTRARPAGTSSHDRSATLTSEEWLHDIVTIRYNRDSVATENYPSYITFEDATNVDDSGGEGKPITIKARNTYGQFINTGQGIEQIAGSFLTHFTLFSRPLRKQTLSISPALYEQVSVGDVVNVFDSFARDPATGLRGISARQALVIRARYNRGGAQRGDPRGISPQGEIDVIYSPDGARPGIYSYAATLDETVTGGGFSAGYNSGTLTLRCKTHDNSEASETRDAGRFVNGDKILIVERDPANSASPISWSRTVTGTPVNDDIVLNAALAAPAFDAAKKYRIIYDHFAVQQNSQQLLASQADSTDALIENAAPPFQFNEIRSAATFTAYDPTIPTELIPDVSYGDGKPLDVGHEFALFQSANLVSDYRTARHLPMVFESAVSSPSGAYSGYALLGLWPIHLGYEPSSGIETRQITVAPIFRSQTGASSSVRITLVANPPEDGATPPGDMQDVTVPFNESNYVVSTSSITFAIPSSGLLVDVRDQFRDQLGVAWVLVEGTQDVELWGIAQFDQGARQ